MFIYHTHIFYNCAANYWHTSTYDAFEKTAPPKHVVLLTVICMGSMVHSSNIGCSKDIHTVIDALLRHGQNGRL